MNHLYMFLYGLLGAYVYAFLMKLGEEQQKKRHILKTYGGDKKKAKEFEDFVRKIGLDDWLR